jgi:hypothetical protein
MESRFVQRGSALLAIVFVAACSSAPVVNDTNASSSSSSGGERSNALPGGDARGGPAQRGQTLNGVLTRNESHDYQIELRGGESVHFDVTGATEAGSDRCDSWDWSWLNPANEWTNGNPGPVEHLDDRSAPRSFSADVSAGAEQPGRWTFRLHATEQCAGRLRYRLSVR